MVTDEPMGRREVPRGKRAALGPAHKIDAEMSSAGECDQRPGPIAKLDDQCLAMVFQCLETRVLVNVVPAVCAKWRRICRGSPTGSPVQFDIVLTGRQRRIEPIVGPVAGTGPLFREWIRNVLLARFRWTIRSIEAKYLNVEADEVDEYFEVPEQEFLKTAPRDEWPNPRCIQAGMPINFYPELWRSFFSHEGMDSIFCTLAASCGQRLQRLDLTEAHAVGHYAMQCVADVCNESLRSVKLAGTTIEDATVLLLLNRCPSLEELDIRECECVSGGWLNVAGGLAYPNLTKLGLGGRVEGLDEGAVTLDGENIIGFMAPGSYLDRFRGTDAVGGWTNHGHTIVTLGQSVALQRAFPGLRELCFTDATTFEMADLENMAVEGICGMISGLRELESLAFGSILRPEINVDGIADEVGLADKLVGILAATNVKRLAFNRPNWDLSWISSLVGLTHLSLAWSEVTEQTFDLITSNCRDLESVDLRRRGYFTENENGSFAYIPMLAKLPRLVELRAAGTFFEPRELVEACPDLEALDLSECFVDDRTCVHLGGKLKRLKKLFFGGNDDDTRTDRGLLAAHCCPYPPPGEPSRPMFEAWRACPYATRLNRVTVIGFEVLLEGCPLLTSLALGSADIPDEIREQHHNIMALNRLWHDKSFMVQSGVAATSTEGW